MEYNWEDIDIKNRIDKLKLLYNSTNNQEQKEIIKSQIDYTNKFFEHLQTNYRQPRIFEAYQDLKEYVYNEAFSWDPIYNFIDNIDGFSLVTPSSIEMSNDELITITHDFYKTLSPDIYNAYLKFYNMRYDHVKFASRSTIEGSFGYTYLFPTLKEYYEFISRNGTICDIFTSIHESGHIIWGVLNDNYVWKSNNYIEELIPIAMELISSDYLKKDFDDQPLRYTALIHGDIAQNVFKWDCFMDLLAIEQDKYGKFKNTHQLTRASKELELSRKELKGLLNLVDFPEMYRIIPYIYAIELYYLYKEDPEYACSIMKKIILDNTKEPNESIAMLENLGLNANKHSKDYHESLVLSLKKSNENKQKQLIKTKSQQ